MEKIKKILQSQNIKQDLAKFLMIVGIWLRGRGLDSPLCPGEMLTINISRLPLPYLLKASWITSTPPLSYLIIKPFSWLENAPWLARIPSLLFSILALAVVWEMIDDWGVTDNQRLWISGLTLLPGFYWMAQDARAYAMLGLLYLISAWLMQGGQYRWAVVTMTLMIWTHPSGVILTISLVLVCLIRDWLIMGLLSIREIFKTTARITTLAGLAALLIGAPALLPILARPVLEQSVSGGHYLSSIYTAAFVGTAPAVGLVVFVFYLLEGLAVLYVTTSDWMAYIKEGPQQKIPDDVVVASGLLVIIPAILMIIVSVLTRSRLLYGPLMPLLYPLIIWVGSSTAIKEFKPHKLIAPALLAALLIYSNIIWDPGIKGADLFQPLEPMTVEIWEVEQ